jgi:hypothetical protein
MQPTSHRATTRVIGRAALTALAALAVLGTASCTDDSAPAGDGPEPSTGADREAATTETEPVPEAGAESEVYSVPANWLCRPDVDDDPCDVDLDATRVTPDGTQTPEPADVPDDPPIDCFYVYPTISTDPGQNSDRVPGDPETGIASGQAAGFSRACRVYAPMYRQTPLGAMFDRLEAAEAGGTTTTLAPDDPANPRYIAYSDVRDAFLHYLAVDSDGRDFVLIGHSQGAGHLARLVAEEIEGDEALLDRMQSALLIGSRVLVGGEDATFEQVEPCASSTDTGCVVSYASFYAAEPPPENSLFGRAGDEGSRALCTNPVDLSTSDGGGVTPLSSHFPAGSPNGAPEVGTPLIDYDGVLTAQCVRDGDFDYLAVTPAPLPDSGLPTDFGGRLTPMWGTHLLDVNLAMGNLVDLVKAQSGQA